MQQDAESIIKIKGDVFVDVSQLSNMEDYLKIEEIWFCKERKSKRNYVVLKNIDTFGETRNTRIDDDDCIGLMANIFRCNNNKEYIKRKFFSE